MTPTTNWRDVIKVHPAAELFPLMTPDELRDLTEANGPLYVVCWQRETWRIKSRISRILLVWTAPDGIKRARMRSL